MSQQEIKIGQIVTTEHFSGVLFAVTSVSYFDGGRPRVISCINADNQVREHSVIPLNPKQLTSQSASIFKIAQEDWKKTGPEFNAWYEDYKMFSLLVSTQTFDWVRAPQFKYINVRADLRANRFRIFHEHNGDGNVETDPITFLNSMVDRRE